MPVPIFLMYHKFQTQIPLPWKEMANCNSAAQWGNGTYIIRELRIAFQFQNWVGCGTYIARESATPLKTAQIETE